MARLGWGVALTRAGLEHADILGVHSSTRHLVEVQVKTASFMPKPNWPVNPKAQEPSTSDREWFVLVALGHSASEERLRVCCTARSCWGGSVDISRGLAHAAGVLAGRRNAGVDRARVGADVFERYLDRWDLLLEPTVDAPVLLPSHYRELALSDRVGLPPGTPGIRSCPTGKGVPDAPTSGPRVGCQARTRLYRVIRSITTRLLPRRGSMVQGTMGSSEIPSQRRSCRVDTQPPTRGHGDRSSRRSRAQLTPSTRWWPESTLVRTHLVPCLGALSEEMAKEGRGVP